VTNQQAREGSVGQVKNQQAEEGSVKLVTNYCSRHRITQLTVANEKSAGRGRVSWPKESAGRGRVIWEEESAARGRSAGQVKNQGEEPLDRRRITRQRKCQLSRKK
jgi:hypothetical protein